MSVNGGQDEWTAFVETAADLGRQARLAEVDVEALGRPLRRCELAVCRAACCHDGVVIGDEEARVIAEVVGARAATLAGFGWERPCELFVRAADGKLRTATRAAGAGELADDFPPHFARTRCVMLDGGHRCVLQRLAAEAGRRAWYWKPLSCWLHPLVLLPAGGGRGVPRLTVRRPADDPERFGSCTHCGRPAPDGEPAARVLAAELEMLGGIAGREFLGEVRGGGG